jgi:hypothetical protein
VLCPRGSFSDYEIRRGYLKLRSSPAESDKALRSVYFVTTPEKNKGNTIRMDKIPKWNIVHKLQKRSLLIAINCLAGLSIFFFGYDQGEDHRVSDTRRH